MRDISGAQVGGPTRHREIDDRRHLSGVLERAKAGDTVALSYLYERYAPDVRRYVGSIVRDEYEAEDITQNVFIKLMRILPKYEEREIPFSGWLLRVSRNVALDYLRGRRLIPCEEVRDPSDAGEDRLERNRSLREALMGLSPEQRRVVLWRHLVGLSPVEIADRLGRTEGSIHALHHRGRRAIQTELRATGAAPSTIVVHA